MISIGRTKCPSFEYNYLLFLAECAVGDEKKAGVYHAALDKVFQLQKKFSADIVSLENSIDGMYYLIRKKYESAQAAYGKVKEDALTRHERARYYYFFSRLCAECGRRKEAEKYYAHVLELAPKVPAFVHRRP